MSGGTVTLESSAVHPGLAPPSMVPLTFGRHDRSRTRGQRDVRWPSMSARRFPWCACLAMFVISTLAALLAPASAANADPSCSEGEICFWTGADFQGTKMRITRPRAGRCTPFSEPAMSGKNMTENTVVLLYADAVCGIAAGNLEPGGMTNIIPAAAYSIQ